MTGPYRAEFGAIHYEGQRGFLFTVSPASCADEVAKALNTYARLASAEPDRAEGDEDGAWIIHYEDRDREQEVFVGFGAREAAQRRYEQVTVTWNAHLFERVKSALPAPPTPAVEGEGAVGSAEREVGRAVYERVEKLVALNPAPGTSEWVELDYLSHLAESVEEVGGYDGPLSALSSPSQEQAGAVAWDHAFRWRDQGWVLLSNFPPDFAKSILAEPSKWQVQPLYAHPQQQGAVDVARAAAGIDDDYMTSEAHHPGYVLIPTAKFEAIRAAIATQGPGQ